MANNFLYTEPATGISMGSFESGGVHFQGMVLTTSAGAALPADSTYGLGVDIKRIGASSTLIGGVFLQDDDGHDLTEPHAADSRQVRVRDADLISAINDLRQMLEEKLTMIFDLL